MRPILTAGIAAMLLSQQLHAEQLKPETVAAFSYYVELSEQRMAGEVRSGRFLRIDGLSNKDRDAVLAQLKDGEVVVERLETLDQGRKIAVPGGLIHHWIGTVFIPGVTLAQTVTFLQDYDGRSKYYAPAVERSRLIQRNDDNFRMYMRLREKKIITIVLDTDYDITYTSLGPDRTVCRSVTTRVAQVENDGQKDEFDKPVGNDSGFMWRLNTYWRMEHRDDGTYVQLEAISLSRAIPAALAWLIGPFVNSFPKQSLEFTLGRTREALLGKAKGR
jgi:hypothetical protein